MRWYARHYGEDEGSSVTALLRLRLRSTRRSINTRRTVPRSCGRIRDRDRGVLPTPAPRDPARHAAERPSLPVTSSPACPCVRARPAPRASPLEPRSVLKKLKQPSFARRAPRRGLRGCQLLGSILPAHASVIGRYARSPASSVCRRRLASGPRRRSSWSSVMSWRPASNDLVGGRPLSPAGSRSRTIEVRRAAGSASVRRA